MDDRRRDFRVAVQDSAYRPRSLARRPVTPPSSRSVGSFLQDSAV